MTKESYDVTNICEWMNEWMAYLCVVVVSDLEGSSAIIHSSIPSFFTGLFSLR